MYWISVLSNLQVVSTLVLALGIIALVILSCVILMEKGSYCENTMLVSRAGKTRKLLLIPVVIAILICIFVPSKRDLYLILGVGATIDYLKENETAKELPDKCIKALNNWVESLEEE